MSTNHEIQAKPARKDRVRARMPWWRAYEGLPTNSRWKVIARRSKRPFTEVLGVALCLLDHASTAEDRGDVSGFDVENCAVGLDIETEAAEAIVAALEATRWIADGRIATWDDRQTAVNDPGAAERQRNKRDRDRAAKLAAVNVTPNDRDVTLRHGGVTACHDREEESKSEEITFEDESWSLSADLRKRIGHFFDALVWPSYPKGDVHQSVQSARRKFIDLVVSGADPEEILVGVQRYADTEPDSRYVRSAVNFLAEQDWNEGEPVQDREWDANEEPVLWIPVGVSGTEEGELSTEAEKSADIIVAAFSNPDGSRRTKPLFPKDFGRPPVGFCLAA